MTSTTTRNTAILVLLFVVASATLILLDQHHRLDVARSPAETLVRPFATLFEGGGRALRGLEPGQSSDLQKQLQAMTAERNQLLAENARLRLLQDEVDQLRKQLNFQQQHPGMTEVTANVIGHDPNASHEILVLDRGTKDGIEKGMAVVSPDFYIGQVSDVTEDSARVVLVTDSSAHVGAMIARSGATGVLDGRWQAGGYFQIDHLQAGDDVVEGDIIITSGSTSRVPKGLVVGKVSHVERQPQAATATARGVPLLDLNSLRSVTVILSGGNNP